MTTYHFFAWLSAICATVACTHVWTKSAWAAAPGSNSRPLGQQTSATHLRPSTDALATKPRGTPLRKSRAPQAGVEKPHGSQEAMRKSGRPAQTTSLHRTSAAAKTNTAMLRGSVPRQRRGTVATADPYSIPAAQPWLSTGLRTPSGTRTMLQPVGLGIMSSHSPAGAQTTRSDYESNRIGPAAADIQRQIASHRSSIQRRCWQPVLNANPTPLAKAAKVYLLITIDPNGSVREASARGGAGYPGLASCVASQARTWKVHASTRAVTTMIPFAFFGQ